MAEWIERRTVYEGRTIRVQTGKVKAGNGEVMPFDVVEHHGGAAVAPLLGDRVILVRQPRPVIGRDLLEIPAGKLEGPDDDPAARAQAELGEEIGYRAGRLIPAAQIFVSPGYCTEVIHVYLGLDLTEVEADPDATEEIERIALPLDEVRWMLDEGLFHDGKTIVGLRALLAYIDRRGEEGNAEGHGAGD